jgi:hypothetical protein
MTLFTAGDGASRIFTDLATPPGVAWEVGDTRAGQNDARRNAERITKRRRLAGVSNGRL